MPPDGEGRRLQPLYRLVDSALRAILSRVRISPCTEHLALQWGYRYAPAPRTIVLRSGLRFGFAAVDYIPLSLYYFGTFEPHVIACMRSLVRPGDVILDVGANIGFHTLEGWRMVGDGGRVISVEASPDHVAAIRANLELNAFPVDDLVNCAVGNARGTVTLALPDGGNQGMFAVGAGDGSSAFEVELRTIDDLLAQMAVSSLSLIKMDIEGSELAALRGSVDALTRYKPHILIELNEPALHRYGATARDVIRFLGDFGYAGWRISGAGISALREEEHHDCSECLFLQADSGPARNLKRLAGKSSSSISSLLGDRRTRAWPQPRSVGSPVARAVRRSALVTNLGHC